MFTCIRSSSEVPRNALAGFVKERIISTRYARQTCRLISYKVLPPPPSRRDILRKRIFVASLSSAISISLYYTIFPHVRSAESDARQYSSKVKITDTATHPRNFQVEVADAESARVVLESNEKSVVYSPGSGSPGILSYYFNQVASNSPIEDDHVEAQWTGDATDWSFFGVFDGHGGWTTSAKLKRDLVPYIKDTLQTTGNTDIVAVEKAIQAAFLKLDHEIVDESAKRALTTTGLSKAEAVTHLMPAMSGSCALLASYNTAASTLHVAVTGDSRAIFVDKTGSTWSVRALSEDQTGSTTSEVARLRAEHPGEANVVRNGRILGGLEPSRAFGDSRYKWSAETQSKIAEKFYGRRAPAGFISPPYVTAKPEVTSTKIDLSKQGFMVLGTDGLYEMLTNEEIAALVIGWQEKYQPAAHKSWVPDFLGGSSVPIIKNADHERTGQKTPQSSSKKQFVYQDSNVATHIIRNALGGGDTNRLFGLLSLPYPLSRSYRDDISVTVVFFGEDDRRTPNQANNHAKL